MSSFVFVALLSLWALLYLCTPCFCRLFCFCGLFCFCRLFYLCSFLYFYGFFCFYELFCFFVFKITRPKKGKLMIRPTPCISQYQKCLIPVKILCKRLLCSFLHRLLQYSLHLLLLRIFAP